MLKVLRRVTYLAPDGEQSAQEPEWKAANQLGGACWCPRQRMAAWATAVEVDRQRSALN